MEIRPMTMGVRVRAKSKLGISVSCPMARRHRCVMLAFAAMASSPATNRATTEIRPMATVARASANANPAIIAL